MFRLTWKFPCFILYNTVTVTICKEHYVTLKTILSILQIKRLRRLLKHLNIISIKDILTMHLTYTQAKYSQPGA